MGRRGWRGAELPRKARECDESSSVRSHDTLPSQWCFAQSTLAAIGRTCQLPRLWNHSVANSGTGPRVASVRSLSIHFGPFQVDRLRAMRVPFRKFCDRGTGGTVRVVSRRGAANGDLNRSGWMQGHPPVRASGRGRPEWSATAVRTICPTSCFRGRRLDATSGACSRSRRVWGKLDTQCEQFAE